MKYRNLLYLLASVAMLLPGCTNDIPKEGIGENTGAKRYISLAISDPQHIVTRTGGIDKTADCLINDAYLIVFDSDGAYKAAEKVDATDITENGTEAPRIATALTIDATDRAVILCNTGVASLPADITQENINTKFPATGWNLKTGIPMSGIVTGNGSGAESAPECVLTCSVAKIELKIGVSPENDPTNAFTGGNVEWGMGNVLALNKGSVYADPLNMGIIPPADLTEEDFSVPSLSALISEKSTCYTPEFAASTWAKTTPVNDTDFSVARTCMVVKAGDNYYRIDLFDHNTRRFIDIRRNTHITVKITSVKSPGYTTMAAALAAPGSNLEYEVKVDSDYNIVASNGQYALAFDRTEATIDRNEHPNGVTNFEVAKACCIFPAGVTLPLSEITNTIEVTAPADPADPAALTDPAASADPTASINGITLHTIRLTDTPQSILISTTSATTYPFTLTVRLGNIVRTLTVKAKTEDAVN